MSYPTIRWEKQGNVLVLVTNGWKRGIITPEGKGYIAVGIFGAKLFQVYDTNRDALKKILVENYGLEFGK